MMMLISWRLASCRYGHNRCSHFDHITNLTFFISASRSGREKPCGETRQAVEPCGTDVVPTHGCCLCCPGYHPQELLEGKERYLQQDQAAENPICQPKPRPTSLLSSSPGLGFNCSLLSDCDFTRTATMAVVIGLRFIGL